MAGRKLACTSHTPVCACWRYVVRPMTGLEALKSALPLPVGDGGVERLQLDVRVVQVVVDHLVTELFAGDRRLVEEIGGFGQRGRKVLGTAGIGVARQGF